MKEQFVAKRIINIGLIFLAAIVFSVVAGITGGLYLDILLGIGALTILFAALLVFLLIYERNRNRIAHNRETDYGKIAKGFLLSAVAATAFLFLPEFASPVMILPVIMSAAGTYELSVCSSFFFCVILEIAKGSSSYEVLCDTMLLLFGFVIVHLLEDAKNKVWYLILTFAVAFVVPVLFSYFFYQEPHYDVMVKAAIAAALTDLSAAVVYPLLARQKEHEIDNFLTDITEEDYMLLRELKNFSRQEYRHALRVSRVCEKCAKLVGADAAVSKAAGLYYRIGILDGDPMVENGVMRARTNCFPERVTEILSEYYGMEKMPSSIESAIVQMVDGLIKKLEALDKTSKIEGGWNKEMVIYQTLNDFSAQGLYDQSGLSMNMFLKIREYLVKEEALLL